MNTKLRVIKLSLSMPMATAIKVYAIQVGGSAWDVFQTRAEVIRVFELYLIVYFQDRSLFK